MNMETEQVSAESEVKQGWVEETEKYRQNIAEFFQNHQAQNSKERASYDSLTELHYSDTLDVGGSYADLQRISSVRVLYGKNNLIEQIHVVYKKLSGGFADVYFQGKALEDLLNQNIENK